MSIAKTTEIFFAKNGSNTPLSMLRKKVIIDTGFIVALFYEKDKLHQSAIETEEIMDSYEWISTHFVIHEIFWLLTSRGKRDAALNLLQIINEGGISVSPLPTSWAGEMATILRKYQDQKLDIADASIVVLADHLNLGDIVSVDLKDFATLRWGNGKKCFNNLMQF